MVSEENPEKLNVRFEKISAQEIISHSAAVFKAELTFACSFGAEDMVILDMIEKSVDPIDVFYLDTGRLPNETYKLIQESEQYFSIKLRPIFPEYSEVENFISQYGTNGFYNSVKARQKCCFARKIKPLERALRGKRAWLTGLRRQQSVLRSQQLGSAIKDNGRVKILPLKEWSSDQVWQYIKHHDIPFNDLHKKGYPSIGCAPCTRPISATEDFRAGRWWWENNGTKECGLHTKNGE